MAVLEDSTMSIVRLSLVPAAVCACVATIGALALRPGSAAAGSGTEATQGIAKVGWLAGSWSGPHDDGVIEEHWMAPSGKTMIGMGRLVVDGKTIFFEFLRLKEEADGSVVYYAQPGGRSPATPFKLTESRPGVLVFENPEHDDPKVIRYTLGGNGALTAVTEGTAKDGSKTKHQIDYTRSTLAP